ncbi:MAG: hypothetical protein IPJ65_35190 [Archangiaceae bacterium]|nr:hypothetical protein [Archangiaceae bacterium]
MNGSNNTIYNTVSLAPAGVLPSNGYLVIAPSGVTVAAGALKLSPAGWATDAVQNGSPDGVALINTTNHTLVDALSYEGQTGLVTVPGFAAQVNLVEGTFLPITVADSNAAPGTLCRIPNGVDADNATNDWRFCATVTPGAANVP